MQSVNECCSNPELNCRAEWSSNPVQKLEVFFVLGIYFRMLSAQVLVSAASDRQAGDVDKERAG